MANMYGAEIQVLVPVVYCPSGVCAVVVAKLGMFLTVIA